MRIISGSARGKKLLSPVGNNTRPTLDRVKESMFSIIQTFIFDSVVIDLFSGTGSLGLEAISRGAKKGYLVEKDYETFKLLDQNTKNFKFEDRSECFNMEALNVLKKLKNSEITFDIVFIDPPYKMNMIPPCIEFISQSSMLSRKGIIVTKIDSSEEIYYGDDNIILHDKREYGNTTIVLYKYKNEN